MKLVKKSTCPSFTFVKVTGCNNNSVKRWLPEFSPFPTMLSKAFLLWVLIKEESSSQT